MIMENKIILEELTTENLVGALKELKPGTMLVIDLPEQDKDSRYAMSTQEGDEKDGGTL